MLARNSVAVPASALLAVSCLMGIILLGGCPQQQVPSQPSEANETTTTPATTTPGAGESGRPIPPPIIVPSETEGTTPSGGGGTTGGGTGGGGIATYAVTFTAPLNPVAVRPGAVIDLTYKLTDAQGIVNGNDLVVARDDDADGKPDGDPVLFIPATVVRGSRTLAFNTSTSEALHLIQDRNLYGRFVLGLRVSTSLGEVKATYASGLLTVDGIMPTAAWVTPAGDNLVNPGIWPVAVRTMDNSRHTVKILLDSDTDAANGFAGTLVGETPFSANNLTDPSGVVHPFNPLLSISPGTYYYYVIVSDGIDPPTTFYAPNLTLGSPNLARLAVTNRIVGQFDLNQLAQGSPRGAVLEGFNYNDLAGSSMVSVPDLNGDGIAELVIGSRFGKPNLTFFNGQGWGEAYMIYGQRSRLTGVKKLNSVGNTISGVTFRGIRVPLNTNDTMGLSDITVVPDMDGDDRPELVFSFPRVESISLAEEDPTVQHPDLKPDIAEMGNLEYDAFYGGSWHANEAQFTRGGIAIASSHNQMLTNSIVLTRKVDRVLDLHEVGQMFSWMKRASVYPYIVAIGPDPNLPAGCADCIANVFDPNDPNDCLFGCADCGGIQENPSETRFRSYDVVWDAWLGGG